MASDEPEQLSLFDKAMAEYASRRADDAAAHEAFHRTGDEREDAGPNPRYYIKASNKCLLGEPPPLTSKDTNPKDAVGTKKAPLSTVSAPVMAEVGLAMLEGARKYGRHNYRVDGVRASVYYDALLRHVMAWWEGEDTDPDSGLSHIVKAVACLMVLRDSMIQGNWIDDRPPVSPAGWLAELNARAAEIVERYPDAKPAHVALDAVR